MAYDQSILDKVREIAQDCQGGHASFCNARCPMHTDVTGYVELISENKVTEALLKIREKLFLPGTLGRICAHPCETECRRNTEFGQPISIAALKRYAADKADDEKLWDVSKKPDSGKKVAVIGAGPAGAQAAIDLAKEGHNVTVFEKLNVVGGMMRVGIPEYRLPRDIIDAEYKYLDKLGVTFKMGVEIGRDITFDELLGSHDAVVVANGAHKGSIPPMKGAEAGGITNAAEFLRSVSLDKQGVQIGKNVIVVGGGDVAMDCARSALRLGASAVTAVSLEKEDEMPASKHEQEAALAEGIVFKCGWGGEEIRAENGRVSGILLKQCTSVFDADGRFSPVYGDEKLALECDTIIFATGQLVEDVAGGALKQGGGGRYAADKQTLATSIDKVFVAGDCAGGTIVVEAMALGRKASFSVNRFLAGLDLSLDRDFGSEYNFETELDIPLEDGVRDLPRVHTSMLDPMERVKSFAECDLGFDDGAASEESRRCLKCECKKCMKECIMLGDFTLYPGALFKKFLEDGDIEPLVAYSCNMCDQCTLVCPEEFKFSDLFGAIRKQMVKANNGQSPIPGHKAINMHQKLGFSKLFTVRLKGGGK
ncbi:MAG: FAD-dependent oxidoreductase [Oscillospiraceae bacterium]|jgi:NADPH-dependent glutamate synthase beta subunit-like oxidoreductase|nr:FAD-dependent oxidoreductase [Oscillospiraceae bacterium]